MALVFNATKEQQSVKAFGNWFTFKPKQVKALNDNIANFLTTDRSESGLVTLSESLKTRAM